MLELETTLPPDQLLPFEDSIETDWLASTPGDRIVFAHPLTEVAAVIVQFSSEAEKGCQPLTTSESYDSTLKTLENFDAR